jgi:hypothetical protein
MKLEVGTVTIALAVLLITFVLFGGNLPSSFRAELLYGMKTTVMMAPLLFVWFAYNEPAALSWAGALVSVCVAVIFTLGRSYLVALL